ncbi:hypothetical protein Ddye_023365 [Dipteronia dyeriana]|uniref:PGG domain-containing protein n=1 Tax=Dipteronia dyeriana TaxID=168575 RepID=A0AAD9TST3_9ROSI|nr:hypothetical protein Ddye_023365 [Dipteronia dyeriana]
MEAATKDNDIEMARGTSAADSEPNKYCSNSEFEKEETVMASSSNDRGKGFELIDSLYSAAADGDIKKFEQCSEQLEQILTPNGNTILHIHITARNIKDTYFVREMLGMCPDLLWKANKKGETLLHMAARHGHANVAKFLLLECQKIPYKNQYDDQEHGITPTRRMLRKTSQDAKDTALHEAVRYHHLDVVRLFTEADRELTYEANAVGETPLYLTAERGYTELLEEILSNCSSPGDNGPYDRTALHVAVIRSDEEMVERLLEAGDGIHKSKQDQHGWTPLHFAAHLGYIEILKKLLSKDKSAAYKACNEGKTALHVAAGLGRVDIMDELISTCPGCFELIDERGRNVLHFALESRNKKAVKLAFENPWLGNLINEKDENGNTPFLHAASIGYYSLIDPGVDIRVFKRYRVDMQVFNHHNHNAADIISANKSISEWLPDLFLWVLENYKVKRGLRMIVSENDNIGKRKDEGNTVKSKSKGDGGVEDEGNRMSSKSNNGRGKNISIADLMKKTGKNDLVAATLIATVTFAAGFTVPGGFVADKGPDQGAAILTRSTAFRTFVILNTMSMFLSCLAVFHLLARSSDTHVRDTRVLFKQMRLSGLLITYATMAMIGAFLSGMCAVLHNDRDLAVSTCVVPVIIRECRKDS